MSKIAEGLLYSESHEWVKVDGNVAIIGVSDFAQSESVKTSSELIAPVSGKVVARNDELEDKPELINEDAYEAWIIKVEMSDASELDALLNASAYANIAK